MATSVLYHASKVARQDAPSATPTSNSASTLLSTLVPVIIFSAIYIALFLVLRRIFVRVYQPRSFLSSISKAHRSPSLPNTLFGWIGPFFKIPDTTVLNTQSLDGFLFLRLLKIMVVTCLVAMVVCWPILFAVNATGPGMQKQLDIISMANATIKTNPTSYFRWFAHAGCAWIVFGFLMYMITRESIYYINLRQAYLVSPLYANRVSSKTVLFTSVPDNYLNEALLREMLGPGVVRVWIPRDTKELEEGVKERDKVAMKLEAAETKLVKAANAARLKSLKKGGEGGPAHAGEEGSVVSRWLTPKQRPTHKLKFLIGKKVDTIDWCRDELSKKIPDVDQQQAAHLAGKTKPLHSVFVQFTSLREAQSAYQSLTHHQALHMSERYTGCPPDEIIWKNLDIGWLSRVLRQFIVIGFVTGLVIFWTIPVALIGGISSVTTLKDTYSWLSWLNAVPPSLLGVISGLLPTILLAVLMALLPIFLRLAAKFAGSATLAEVEYRVQNYYFAFQVVQVFLIQSVASGAISSLSQIAASPGDAPSFLAQRLPTASNFYIAYFILQGLAVMSGVLLSIVGLILFKLLSNLLDKTPRKKLTRWMTLTAPGLGTVYPIFTNLFVIAIAYSIIAPLVLGFAAIGVYFFYIAYRYEWLFVYGSKYDTKGLMYPRALQQLFVGLYIAELCITGIFGIGLGSAPKQALGPFIMMILLVVFTALYHISLNAALGPLLKYLPKTLETEERRLLAMEDADYEASEIANNGNGQSAHTDHDSKLPTKERAPVKKPGMIQKFIRPDVYTDYHTLRKLVPRDFASIQYDDKTESDAYHHPATVSQPPLLWIPRDPMGVSRQEVHDTSRVIPITDEGAVFNDKNQIEWDTERAMEAPIYEEKIYY